MKIVNTIYVVVFMLLSGYLKHILKLKIGSYFRRSKFETIPEGPVMPAEPGGQETFPIAIVIDSVLPLLLFQYFVSGYFQKRNA